MHMNQVPFSYQFIWYLIPINFIKGKENIIWNLNCNSMGYLSNWKHIFHLNYYNKTIMFNVRQLPNHYINGSLNSLRPSYAYICQYNMPTMLQIMACHLFGAKPLSEPMLPYCQLDPKEHISVKSYLKFKVFIKGNALEMSSAKVAAILPSLNVLKWQVKPFSRRQKYILTSVQDNASKLENNHYGWCSCTHLVLLSHNF